MDDWDNFYMLAGGTAGTLIGLILRRHHARHRARQSGRYLAHAHLRDADPRPFHQSSRYLAGDGGAGLGCGTSGCAWGDRLRGARLCDESGTSVAPAKATLKSKSLSGTCCSPSRPMCSSPHGSGRMGASGVLCQCRWRPGRGDPVHHHDPQQLDDHARHRRSR